MRKLVLDEINWFVQPRGRYVILGHKGSGKTTLLNIIDGSRFPTKGWVERKGSICPGRGIIRASTPGLTPRQLATRLARLYHKTPSEIVAFTARFADMDPAMDHPIASLPIAMRQRLSYALAFAIPFDFYLFDGGIGPRIGEFGERCLQVFDMRCRDAGSIITTSVPNIAKRFEGTGGILYDGKLHLFDTVDEAIAVFNTLPPPDPTTKFAELPVDTHDEEEEWI